MTKREPLMTEAYFDEHIAFVEQVIEEDETDLRNDPAQFTDVASVYFNIFQYRLFYLISLYSRGYPLESLQKSYLLLLDDWEKQRVADAENVYAGDFQNDISTYVQAIWLLSLAYLLHVNQVNIARLLACVRNEGQDLLFERLVAARPNGTARKPARKLLYPKAYQSLYDALDAPVEQQAVLMQEFLKNWYKRMSNTGWHNAHLGPDGGSFDGYWCWEAAGVAYAFGIDDSRFRELPYYPKDLADYARATM
jgi:hypothetical protein